MRRNVTAHQAIVLGMLRGYAILMSFQIRPLKEFLVRPALPPALQRLSELAVNLLWSWDHNLRAVFRRLDPVIWKASNHNPVVMLGRVPQPALERAAADPRFLALYRRGCETHDAYLAAHAGSVADAGGLFFDGIRPARLHADLFGRPGRARRAII